jgi:hypothetical protein
MPTIVKLNLSFDLRFLFVPRVQRFRNSLRPRPVRSPAVSVEADLPSTRKTRGASMPSLALHRGQASRLAIRIGLKLLPHRSHLNISPPELSNTGVPISALRSGNRHRSHIRFCRSVNESCVACRDRPPTSAARRPRRSAKILKGRASDNNHEESDNNYEEEERLEGRKRRRVSLSAD